MDWDGVEVHKLAKKERLIMMDNIWQNIFNPNCDYFWNDFSINISKRDQEP